LAQTARLVSEMEAKEKERREKEQAQLANARVMRDMEIAEQIQISLLPDAPRNCSVSIWPGDALRQPMWVVTITIFQAG